MSTKVFTTFALMLIVLSACGPTPSQPVGSINTSQAWIDAPLQGSRLPLAEVEIVAHAASPSGIASFEIKLNGQLLANTGPDPDSLDKTLVYTRHSWQPSEPGNYLIEVTGFDLNNQPGSPAQVVVEIGGLTPTITPTQTQTSTPTCGPLTFTPNINAYCRQGPGEVFPALENLAMKGQAYMMDGRNSDGSWYRIMLTSVEGCWVPTGVGTPSCDPGKLRVLLDIPTPTNACSSFTNQKTCELQSNCRWNLNTFGPGSCIGK